VLTIRIKFIKMFGKSVTMLASGLNATLRIGAVCPPNMTSLKVSRLTTLTVMSVDPAQIWKCNVENRTDKHGKLELRLTVW
jgi:hypothetical protein